MKLLLIEDETKLAKNICTFLEREHFIVDWFENGDDGYLATQSYPGEYSLLILDGGLPGKDGFSICKDVRKDGFTAPILFLTARDSVAQKVAGLSAGADDYLIKPFDFDELLARIHALLRRSDKKFEEFLECGHLRLHPSSRKVEKSGLIINLTEREFTLLQYLLKNKNKVVSREKLVSIAWDMSVDIASNVVDVHIANIRRKIDDKDQESYIKTIRGSGYTIREL